MRRLLFWSIEQTGYSEVIRSSEACASIVANWIIPAEASVDVVWNTAIWSWPSGLNLSPPDKGAYGKSAQERRPH